MRPDAEGGGEQADRPDPGNRWDNNLLAQILLLILQL